MPESTLSPLQPPLQTIEQVAASALLAIAGGTPAEAQAAFEELARRNKTLLDGGDAAIVEVLARQSTLLEAVVLSLFKSAADAKDANVTRMALSSALSAQRSLVTTLGAIHQVRHRA
jgi:hypothetical protein